MTNLDEGEKIVCFFAPGCDHCRETAKEIELLSKTRALPEVDIFFMNEETDQIQDFFKDCNCNFPYKIIDVRVFWDLMGAGADTPGVLLLKDGSEIIFYEGTDNNKFDTEDLKTRL